MPSRLTGNLTDRLYTALWSTGVRARNVLKRAGMLGALDGLLGRAAHHIIPPPATVTHARLPFDLTLAIPPGHPMGRNFLAGVYEVEVTTVLTSLLAGGMTVMDVGAHIGYYTLLASRRVGPEGRVYAFEPDPSALPWLRENVARNDCGNVVVVERAAANQTGDTLLVDGDHRHWRAFDWTSSRGDGVRASTVSLDAFLEAEGWPPVHLLKMDIEGAEHGALRGMVELCRRNPGLRLIMELNSQMMRAARVTPGMLAHTLGRLGFDYGYIIEQRLRPFAVAEAFPTSRAILNVLLTHGPVDLSRHTDGAAATLRGV